MDLDSTCLRRSQGRPAIDIISLQGMKYLSIGKETPAIVAISLATYRFSVED
jgi:hypothetical protein